MKQKPGRKRSVFTRVYWSRVGLVVALAVAAVSIAVCAEERRGLAYRAATQGVWESHLNLREAQIAQRRQALSDWEAGLAKRETAQLGREAAADCVSEGLVARERELVRREMEFKVLRDSSGFNPDLEFRRGRAAYERGEFEAAERHFRNVLRGGATHEQATRYRDEAGYRYWVDILARGGKLSERAKELLKRADPSWREQRQY